MLTKEELFAKAAAYDFDAIRAYLESGGGIDIYDGYGKSLFAALLAGYYSCVYYSDPDETRFLKEHDEDEAYFCHVNKYSRMPLDKRPHAIKTEIDYLMVMGISLNAVGWKEAEAYQKDAPCVETPLFQAVVNCDYCMTEYLLEHGADPGQKLFTDGDYDDFGYEDWLPEHLDIYISSGDSGNAAKNDLEIVALLMRHGLDRWRGYTCIDVDPENRVIYGGGFQAHY